MDRTDESRKEMEIKRETKGDLELGKDRHKDRWK